MQILGIQTGTARKAMITGRAVLTAIHKTSVTGPVAVKPMELAGDEQADPSVHRGLEKAIYAYPSEHYAYWQDLPVDAGLARIDEALPFRSVGENLSIQGLLESDVWVGDLLEFADCTLRVEQPREPCFKFNTAMDFNTAVKAMAHSGYCGFYLSVQRPGTLRPGEAFVLHPGTRSVNIPERFKAKMFKHMC